MNTILSAWHSKNGLISCICFTKTEPPVIKTPTNIQNYMTSLGISVKHTKKKSAIYPSSNFPKRLEWEGTLHQRHLWRSKKDTKNESYSRNLMNIDTKNFKLVNRIQNNIKKCHTPIYLRISPEYDNGPAYVNQRDNNKKKRTNQHDHPTDADKVFDNVNIHSWWNSFFAKSERYRIQTLIKCFYDKINSI